MRDGERIVDECDQASIVIASPIILRHDDWGLDAPPDVATSFAKSLPPVFVSHHGEGMAGPEATIPSDNNAGVGLDIDEIFAGHSIKTSTVVTALAARRGDVPSPPLRARAASPA